MNGLGNLVQPKSNPPPWAKLSYWMAQQRWLVAIVSGLFLASMFGLLFSLTMHRRLSHDEHQFIASAVLVAREHLAPYRDFAYFHVPNQTYLWALFYHFTNYYLFVARAFCAACGWLLLVVMLAAFGWPLSSRVVRSLTLSVNISPVQLRDPWFAQKLLKLLVSANFPANRLDVEITETCLHDNTSGVHALITSLKNQGVTISLDEKCRRQARLWIETRTSAYQVQRGEFPEEQITVYFAVRQFGSLSSSNSFESTLQQLRQQCEELLERRVIDQVLKPLQQAISTK